MTWDGGEHSNEALALLDPSYWGLQAELEGFFPL